MVIGYNLFKVRDAYILEVLEACAVKFYYKSGVTDTLLREDELEANESINLITSKDGEYRIVLIDPVEQEETVVDFRVSFHLEKSIAIDAFNILCNNDYDSGCKINKEICLSTKERQVLKSKEVFVKLLTYQSKYIPAISANSAESFNDYMTKAVATYKCNVQNKINNILLDECNGNHTSSSKLFELYLAIYWAGMYFLAKRSAEDQEEQDFVHKKYYYDYISKCLCNLCISLEDLEAIFNANLVTFNTAPTVDGAEILIEPFFFPSDLFTYIFNEGNFTTNFVDAEGDDPNNIQIVATPSIGNLTYDGAVISSGFILSIENVAKLKYTVSPNYSFTSDKVYKFNDPVQSIINDQANDNYSFNSYVDGELIFTKLRDVVLTDNTNVYAFIDTSSLTPSEGATAKEALDRWITSYRANNSSYKGDLYIITSTTENWLSNAIRPSTGIFDNLTETTAWEGIINLPPNINSENWVADTEVLVLNFINEANPSYHSATLADGFGGTNTQPTALFQSDYEAFITEHNNYNFFKGIVYPIIEDATGIGAAFILQLVASLEGRLLTTEEVTAIDTTVDLTILETTNPYDDFNTGTVVLRPLKDLGWQALYNKLIPINTVLLSETFQDDLNALVDENTVQVIDYKSVQGVDVTDEIAVFFKISDNNNNELYSNMAKIDFNIDAYNNQPISQLGNRSIELANRGTHTFTLADFTTLLVPQYLDPEGDPLDSIRINVLPSEGTLLYNNTPVTQGQIITAAGISSGLLKYVGPNVDNVTLPSIDFSARDTGSMVWVD